MGRSWTVAVSILVVFLATSLAAQDLLTDDFDASHDYLADGVAGTIWDGFLVNGGTYPGQNCVPTAANAGLSAPGRLTLESQYGDWEHAYDDGLLLYLDVAGDFVADLEVGAAGSLPYNDLGLMARVATEGDDDSAAGEGEDFVAARYFACLGLNSIRNEDDGVASNFDSSELWPFLQLERRGAHFFVRRRLSLADPWQEMLGSPLARLDLLGLPLQVGIWQATFSSNVDSAQLESFAIDLSPLFGDGFETGDTAVWSAASP